METFRRVKYINIIKFHILRSTNTKRFKAQGAVFKTSKTIKELDIQYKR